MAKFNKFIGILTACLSILSFSLCSCFSKKPDPDNQQSQDIAVETISFELEKNTFYVGETAKIKNVVVNPSDATDKTVEFKSSDISIIKINNEIVEAIGIGSAYVVGNSTSYPDVTFKIKVDVIEEKVPVTLINLSASKTTLNVLEEIQLKTEVLPATATNKSVTYSTLSGNTNIIEVSNQGLVKANAKGKDSVICKSVSNPEITSKIEFDVTEVDASSISVTKTSVTMLTSSTYQINATVLPNNATDKDLSYEVLDRNDYSNKGDRFESFQDYTCSLKKPILLNETINIDIWFDTQVSPKKTTIMFGQGWNQYFGYYEIFSNGTLGADYAGVKVSEPVKGMFRFSFDLSLLNKQSDKPLPDECIDLIYIRGIYSPASGNIKINTDIKTDILSVNSDGLVSAFNLGEQKVRIFCTNQPSIYKDILFNVISNPNDPLGEDVFDNF